MDVIEAMRDRHSTRGYKQVTVNKDIVGDILEAARHTPSWGNSQPWDIFVATGEPLERLRQRNLKYLEGGVEPVLDQPAPQYWPDAHKQRSIASISAQQASIGIIREDKEARKRVTENNIRFFGAPVVFFLCMDRRLDPWSLFDLGAFSQSIMLAAQHYGMNTIPAVMMTAYPQIIREELHVPDELNVIMGIALGYADPSSIQNKYVASKRPLDEFARMAGF